MLARVSDNYFYPSAFVVILVNLLIGFAIAVILDRMWLSVPLVIFLYAQIMSVASALLLLSFSPALRIALTPKRLRYQRAHEAAAKQFLARNIHNTVERTGVLIFVSLAERYAEVVADSGINAKVRQDEWNAIIADLVAKAGAERLTDGFVGAIDAVGAMLAAHFPPRKRNPNELDDHLVEI